MGQVYSRPRRELHPGGPFVAVTNGAEHLADLLREAVGARSSLSSRPRTAVWRSRRTSTTSSDLTSPRGPFSPTTPAHRPTWRPSTAMTPGRVCAVTDPASRWPFSASPTMWSPVADRPPQQLHLDLAVDDFVTAHDKAVALGATALSPTTAPEPDKSIGFRVHSDPAGHPFCLCR